MPSEIFHGITDQDLAAMIAYLKQVPPVDREVPPTTVRLIGRMALGAGQVPLAADLSPPTAHLGAVDTTPSQEYGRYLATISGCQGCHGSSFSGGPGFGPSGAPVSNITATGIGHYTEDDFTRAMRTSGRPGGVALSEEMPWKFFRAMSDGELHAIWLLLKTLPPKQFGER